MREFANLGMLLKRKRMETGLTQAEVGSKLGVHNQFVSNWERGLCGIPNHALDKAISLLKIDRNELADVMLTDSKIHIEKRIFKNRKSKRKVS